MTKHSPLQLAICYPRGEGIYPITYRIVVMLRPNATDAAVAIVPQRALPKALVVYLLKVIAKARASSFFPGLSTIMRSPRSMRTSPSAKPFRAFSLRPKDHGPNSPLQRP